MTVLVLGGAGQVGQALARLRADVVALDRVAADVTSPRAIWGGVARVRPQVVVNAAAFTDVDGAERQRARCMAVNHDGARHVAEACAALGVPLIHLSTDYVFDGRKGTPYAPEDAVCPLGVYGQSKALGEAAVRRAWHQHVILRTAWVLSADRPGFATAVVRRARQGLALRVVDDVWGQPTPASLVAQAVSSVVDQLHTAPWGTWHAAGSPAATWKQVADALVAASGARVPVGGIPGAAWPSRAPRPADTRLDTAAFEARFGVRLVWPDAVAALAEAIG